MKTRIPPPVYGLAAGLLMWGIDRVSGVPDLILPFQRQVGLAVMVAGFLVEVIAVAAFFRARTTVNPLNPAAASRLVTTGLYRFSRNPMYAGLLIMLAGWCLRLGEPLNVLVLIGFVAVLTWSQIKPEEAVLARLFGDEYEAYRRRVRRWI